MWRAGGWYKRFVLWAVDENGDQRLEATPGAEAFCPGCTGPVRAHCGEIKRWHWHHVNADCDPWHEPETEWHLAWKRRFPDEWCEFWLHTHRADVRNHLGTVVEFQHSSLSLAEIVEREKYWQDLIWVFDAREWFSNLELKLQPDKITFRWKQPRKSLFAVERPLLFDTGSELFEVLFLGKKVPCGGSGRFIPYRYFEERINRGSRFGWLATG